MSAARPTTSATSPVANAPTVIEPVKATVKIARPRARTQAGRNSCNSPTKVEVTAIQASPATNRITSAAGMLGINTINAVAAA